MTAIDVLADLIEEVDDIACEIEPCSGDYFYIGVAETMVLDSKKEIADTLYKIRDKYKKLYDKLEEE